MKYEGEAVLDSRKLTKNKLLYFLLDFSNKFRGKRLVTMILSPCPSSLAARQSLAVTIHEACRTVGEPTREKMIRISKVENEELPARTGSLLKEKHCPMPSEHILLVDPHPVGCRTFGTQILRGPNTSQ